METVVQRLLSPITDRNIMAWVRSFRVLLEIVVNDFLSFPQARVQSPSTPIAH